MPIKPGDRVTVSLNPSIKLADFMMLKPFASITREVQCDADVAELHVDVVRLVHAAARNELHLVVNAINSLSNSFDTEALDAYLAQEITHARPQAHTEAGAPSGNDRAAPAPGKPGPKRKS